MIDRKLLADLGVPSDYGKNPHLPGYAEAARLIDVGPNIIGRMQQLAPPTAHAWRRLRLAARRDGIELLLVSGFRSVQDQAELFRKKLAVGQPIEQILRVNAAPGYSQHHTGRAVDVAARGSRPLTEEFAASGAFEWLLANAARFEFFMPYGPDNPFGFAYEPWHWSQLKPESARASRRAAETL